MEHLFHTKRALFILTFNMMLLAIIIQEKPKSLVRSNGQINIAPKIFAQTECAHIIFGTIAQPNSTCRDFWRSATGTCYTCCRNSIVHVKSFTCSNDHLTSHLFANSRLSLKHFMRNMEQILLDLIGV